MDWKIVTMRIHGAFRPVRARHSGVGINGVILGKFPVEKASALSFNAARQSLIRTAGRPRYLTREQASRSLTWLITDAAKITRIGVARVVHDIVGEPVCRISDGSHDLSRGIDNVASSVAD
jgi:hypothetical protein